MHASAGSDRPYNPSVVFELVFPDIITLDLSLSPFDADELSRIASTTSEVRNLP
jgi:hypothetical protein